VPKDSADLHVERWRDHWIDIPFDEQIEAATVRLMRLNRYLDNTTRTAVAHVGLQDFEYQTLHALMIRETPGRASPTALAKYMGVSPAGVTGRLDGLERKGLVKRVPGTADRRTVDVEVTRSGAKVWREAMALREDSEKQLASALTPKELATLNRLLKKLTLHAEGQGKA
jgi:DNA-binding MarR family transcriptional regulator